MMPFEVGSVWRHKNQGIRVFVRDVYEDDEQVIFYLGRVLDKKVDPLNVEHADLFEPSFRYHGWPAEELLRDFTPLMKKLRATVWDRLLGGHLEEVVFE